MDNASSETSRRLFRTVTALGAELRRQGAFDPTEAKVDLIDLAYAAIAAADGAADARERPGTAPAQYTMPRMA